MQAAPLKVAVIGTGRIGALLERDRLRKKPCTHLGAWQKLHAETYIAEPDEGRREAVHLFFQPSGVYADYNRMLDEHQFDVVSVATPAETHKDIVNDIAKKKAARVVFCEKPIATNVVDARSMTVTCSHHGVKLAINHTRRWDPAWAFVKRKFIDGKAYGDVVGSVGYYSGDIVNDGSHIADVVNWFGLRGPKSQVYNLRNIEYLIFELDVFFRTGRVRVTDNGQNVDAFHAEPSVNYEYFNELREMPSSYVGREETPMLAACEQLAGIAKNGGEPWCTGVDGLHALERALRWQEASSREKGHA